MRPLALALGALCFAAPVGAQSVPLLAGASERGVSLRWAWPEGERPHGYHVERRSDGGVWSRLTTAPVERVRDRAAARALLGDAWDRGEAMLFPANPMSELADPETHRSLLLLEADLEPRMAIALGVRYDDSTTERGRSYEYRLVALARAGERVIATTAPVVAGIWNRTPAPDSLEARQGRRGVALRWHTGGPFSAYHVYRARGAGTFARVNDGPVIVFLAAEGAPASPPSFFRDTTLAIGDTLRYAVEGIDALGRPSRRSDPVVVIVRDVEPPLPPPTLTTAVRGDTVIVSWESSPSPDVAAYQLWWSSAREGAFQPVGDAVNATSRSMRDRGRPVATLLWYRVTARDADGNESEPSFVALAEIPDVMPPPAPDSLRGRIVEQIAQLAWRPALASDVLGYRVWRASLSGAEWALLTPRPIAGAAYADTLRRGADHAFLYVVAAVDSAYNEGPRTEPIALRPPDVTPPSAPQLRDVRAGEERLFVRWAANPEHDLVAYRLRWRLRGDTAWRELPDSIARTATADTITAVPARKPIEVTLVAIDDAGLRSAPSEPMTGEAYDRRPPASLEVRRAGARQGERGIVLEWDAPAGDVARVVVLRRDSAGGPLRPIALLAPATRRYVDLTAATKGVEYALRVLDQFGNSADSRRTRRAEGAGDTR